jgi:hypothetical protein
MKRYYKVQISGKRPCNTFRSTITLGIVAEDVSGAVDCAMDHARCVLRLSDVSASSCNDQGAVDAECTPMQAAGRGEGEA